MTYEDSVDYAGDPGRAIGTAKTVLFANNFILEEESSRVLVFRGPGMNNTRQNPVSGATVIELRAEEGSLAMTAHLGGVRFMKRFLLIFPIGLAAGLAGVFAIVFPMTNPDFDWRLLGIPFLAVSPWAVLGPLMARWVKKRTQTALHGFLVNLSKA